MNYVLYDGGLRSALLPFTFTRPVAEIRVGILTLREKWELLLGAQTSTLTEPYLQERYPLRVSSTQTLINASFVPTKKVVDQVQALQVGQVLMQEDTPVAFCSTDTEVPTSWDAWEVLTVAEPLLQIAHTWDIFSKNDKALEADFDLVTQGRTSAPISATNTVFNSDRVFIEEGAWVECSVLNAEKGPIYIGKDALVMEGCMIRGGFALCEKGVLKMGAKIYGATTIGPKGKVCGEVSNSVIFGNTSKGHDGYLGNSVLGEWCNIGADSNNSNLKNNYDQVRLWDYDTEGFARTGLQFCGLMMGDHSKCGINTMFNTGTVIGVNVNIFGTGFPRNFVPSFSWGGKAGFTTYALNKAFVTAKVMMARRGAEFDAVEERILSHVFELTQKWRNY